MKTMLTNPLRALAIVGAVTPTFALAHPGGMHGHDLIAGLGHPLGGADHLLAMVAVGIWSAQQGGRAVWGLPVAFVTMLLAGGALGLSGFGLPYVEQGIQTSLLVLGLFVALSLRISPIVGATLVGIFALFHGYAHGSEPGATVAALPYCIGFAITTAMLHVSGIAATCAVTRTSRAVSAQRIGGFVVAMSGAWLALAS